MRMYSIERCASCLTLFKGTSMEGEGVRDAFIYAMEPVPLLSLETEKLSFVLYL